MNDNKLQSADFVLTKPRYCYDPDVARWLFFSMFTVGPNKLFETPDNLSSTLQHKICHWMLCNVWKSDKGRFHNPCCAICEADFLLIHWPGTVVELSLGLRVLYRVHYSHRGMMYKTVNNYHPYSDDENGKLCHLYSEIFPVVRFRYNAGSRWSCWGNIICIWVGKDLFWCKKHMCMQQSVNTEGVLKPGKRNVTYATKTKHVYYQSCQTRTLASHKIDDNDRTCCTAEPR